MLRDMLRETKRSDYRPRTPPAADSPAGDDRRREALLDRYRAVRSRTELLCEPLETEDYVVQSMPDASPAKWHLAHTSWFFEALLLRPHLEGYESLDDGYDFLFNSYYNSVGEQFTRACRGLVSRPTVREVEAFRRHVDAAMVRLVEEAEEETLAAITPVVHVGMNHEQQHQELLVTDLKHMFSRNPLAPVYRPEAETDDAVTEPPALRWIGHDEGLVHIGSDRTYEDAAEGRFAYDNEGPRHRVFVDAFELASRLVTNEEYRAFMDDGGYERVELWLSDGWATVEEEGWKAPLYWVERDGEWCQYTLAGLRPVRGAEPVTHLSHYEADAYARWRSLEEPGVRLPRESEWEVAAARVEGEIGEQALRDEGRFVDDRQFHPRPLRETLAAAAEERPVQLFGDVWEWTASPYGAYPGYRPPEGALGEYNAKFMSSQMVLRGGSCATPRDHVRATYRNFFAPPARWQFSGLRLARDAG